MQPLLVAAAIAFRPGPGGCAKKEAAPEPVRAVRTIRRRQGNAPAAQEYAAEIRARTESRLGFRVGGKMLKPRGEPGRHGRGRPGAGAAGCEDLRLGQDSARAALAAAQSIRSGRGRLQALQGTARPGLHRRAELERRETA